MARTDRERLSFVSVTRNPPPWGVGDCECEPWLKALHVELRLSARLHTRDRCRGVLEPASAVTALHDLPIALQDDFSDFLCRLLIICLFAPA